VFFGKYYSSNHVFLHKYILIFPDNKDI
jgi:hypothetical protein